MWNETVIEGLHGPQVVNDSKTPSGRVHVGSLRGVLIHDAIYRALKAKGFDDARYTYGIDDYDPMDGLPADAEPWMRDHMGRPLCNVPAPSGSDASDLGNHYISEFLGIFKELGVAAEIYRMRDVYRSGRFNEAIDRILRHADIVRQVYLDVSNAARPTDWLPFQVICEACGKIGTTEVTAYDGREVTYECKPDLVKWAQGCGHRGKVSPFDGHGKLPWKLEWVAKWHSLGITIEGAGKDHCTRGGSRDVAEACLRRIFQQEPPLNVPYEFFLVSGAKMSSSKGIGAAAREMADLLPPEILRFLMIRTPPKKTVNFSSDLEYLIKLYNEHDRLVETHLKGRANELQQKTLAAIEVSPDSTAYHPVGFQLLTALLQLPHLDIEQEIARRSPGGLSAADQAGLHKRLASARYWLTHFAADDERIELQQELPASVATLSHAQRAFLVALGEHFPAAPCDEEGYQRFIFDTARLVPLGQKEAFQAIYRALLDKDQGPKGGAFFTYLQREFLLHRFQAVDYSTEALWTETGLTRDAALAWLTKEQARLTGLSLRPRLNVRTQTDGRIGYRGVLDIHPTLTDGKIHCLRVLVTSGEADNLKAAADTTALETYGTVLMAELQHLGLNCSEPEAVEQLSETASAQ